MDFKIRKSRPHGLSSTEWTESISLWAFSKHLAFAGLGASPGPYVIVRRLAQLVDFVQYWNEAGNCFTLPPVVENDPTERNFVSHRVGKAIADCLAKRESGARFTHCYEDAMRIQGHALSGSRPDFLCDTLTRQFAMESKGYARASVSENEMEKHKAQAGSGPLSVHFSIASVSYDLYSRPKVKYYDPPAEAEYDEELLAKLRGEYYGRILESLEGLKPSKKETIEQEDYVTYEMGRLLPNHSYSFPSSRILIHRRILEREWNSMGWLKDIPKKGIDHKSAFIDSDGIGLGYFWDRIE